jgi:alginate O-acetyltransferase complex protein AlgI
MLFNSYPFLFLFLPVCFLLFWYGGHSLKWRLGLLTAASYSFYSWWQFESWNDFLGTFCVLTWSDFADSVWHWRFTLILLASSSVDYWAAKKISRMSRDLVVRRSLLLALSLAVNLGVLGFFKYFGFFSQIVSDLSRSLNTGDLPVFAMVLPVGISFYTFESISYVVDVYRGLAKPARGYLDYACFISFFPHLVAGPIIRYSDILHQFRDTNWVRRHPDWDQVNVGLVFLTMGMVKKLLIADALAARSNPLWEALGTHGSLGAVGSWMAVLGYTFRIYFDFSGYSDMAVGLGHLFAVRLPQNFHSPYKATDPSDFWRRWHMTLSAWLRDYLYIPLGGNRGGHRARNLLITMLLGGLWHGAAWLFIVWGAWWGVLIALFHVLKSRNLIPSNEHQGGYWFNRQATFLLVIIGWVFFRAADTNTSDLGLSSVLPAFSMFGNMVGLYGWLPSNNIALPGLPMWGLIVFCWAWCNFASNSFEVAYNVQPRRRHAILAGAAMTACVLQIGTPMDFLYFRF